MVASSGSSTRARFNFFGAFRFGTREDSGEVGREDR
jgi:hypothetical protein